MKKIIILLAVVSLLFAGDVLSKRYWGVYMPSSRASADTVLTLPTPTQDYFFCCTVDSVNFRFFDSDSNYVTYITLGPGQCHDSEGNGYRAKYVHINAPDATNTVSFWVQR
jgi:hypothetical protein